MKRKLSHDALTTAFSVALLVACSSASNNNNAAGGTSSVGGSAGAGGTSVGVGGTSTGVVGGNTGMTGGASPGGTANTGGVPATGGTSTGGMSAGGTPGGGGTPTGGSGGTPASGGNAGSATGGAGGTGGTPAAGGSGGDVAVIVPTGPSAGCNTTPPAGDSEGSFNLHEIHITEPIAAHYLTGGADYDSSGPYDFQFRPYSIRLPNGYNPATPYPVIMAGGGCGGNAQNFAGNPGSGYDIDKNREAIFVGLSYVAGCFADGGGATSKMADTPEVPYVHEVLAEVEAHYCADKSRVFMTGTSSGGWESITVGCALANEVRGISPVSGGLRLNRPACTGPQASMFVEGLSDGANPIYEDPPNGSRDSPGSEPARDEILERNGCVAPGFVFAYTNPYMTLEDTAGSAPHQAWDPGYPSCVTYPGCPANFPVVWCALPCGHQCDNETVNGTKIDYKAGMMKFYSGLLSQ